VGGDWGGTTLEVPGGLWKNRLTGESVGGGTIAVAELLKEFPVALLVRE
jgi:(1->4)-alpha-D-glucan 1-alpha-D-glucosylmutase